MYQKVTAETYRLIRSRRRTISVEINAIANVVVRAPLRTPLYEVEAFLRDRGSWIVDRINKVQKTLDDLPALVAPGAFHHRGEAREWQGSGASFKRWENAEASRMLSDHINTLLPGLGLAGLRYSGLKLKRMRRRWGSCSYSGTIVLNTLLIRVPDRCAKAVVAHELAHLVHMNHGPLFKKLVNDIYPEYVAANKELNLWTCVLEAHTSTGSDSINNGKSELRPLCL